MARRKQELTPGENDVLNLIERGNAVDQIAEARAISKPAVYHYIRRLKNKGHLHPDQRIASKGTPDASPDPSYEVTSVVVNRVGDNGHADSTNGGGYGYEVAFDTVLKSSTTEAEKVEKLTVEIKEAEDVLAEMRDHLTLLESRRDALRNAGKALDPNLADASQFAMAE
jgi:DNA-binding CsgD family transcriptional regulator